ncbi:PTS sugar transporter subunit IIA [Sporosalibacterium faouarense]|uniref:PTS sugar transporter subunit IIA n=1 Tax=Sporosalibacterium faouarense TaxID=516123 RepID=UPI00141C6D31|nr:PTS sugar transporter subunit IIA [Sporosalibacterium faouarense]MTI47126.1 PTS sugar transporter subunit IIA [Bacillota bacterium]
MIGIILASHGPLAKATLKSAEMIMGEQENITALALEPQDDPQELKNKIYDAAEKVDMGKGVIILVDLLGGSPGNAAAYLAKDGYPVITGLNLPMLLEVIGMRYGDLEEGVRIAIDAGIEGIKDLREFLRG